MRTVHVVTFTATPETIAAMTVATQTGTPAETIKLLSAPCVQRYYTKRAADKLEAELRATGLYHVERKTMLAGTLEDAFMHITGLCPATLRAQSAATPAPVAEVAHG